MKNKGINKVGLTVNSLDEDYSLLKMSMNEQSIKLWETFDNPKCHIEQKMGIIEILLKIDKWEWNYFLWVRSQKIDFRRVESSNEGNGTKHFTSEIISGW